VIFGVISAAAFAVLLLMVTVWLVRPFGLVTDMWRALRARPRRGSVVVTFAARRVPRHARRAGRQELRRRVRRCADARDQESVGRDPWAAELLREPLPEDARIRFTGNVEEQVRRAQDLVERMLELSRPRTTRALQHRETILLAQLADAVREEMAPLATRRDVELFVDVDPELAVSGDRFLLQRALANLVLNAIEFSPREATVTVDAHDVRGRIELTVRTTAPATGVCPRARIREVLFTAAARYGSQGHRPGTRLRPRGRHTAWRRGAPGEPPGWRRRRHARAARAVAR